MPSAWRIVKEKYLASAFTGEGAADYAGRWNLPGTRMAYTSESQALAALELLVHLNPPVFFKYKAIRIQFDESLVERLSPEELPAEWQAEPPSLLTQRLGSRWASGARSVALAVPSAIIPEEVNFLINPLHPDFSRIKIEPAVDFAFDARLISKYRG
jgi:RES domain-containing protein